MFYTVLFIAFIVLLDIIVLINFVYNDYRYYKRYIKSTKDYYLEIKDDSYYPRDIKRKYRDDSKKTFLNYISKLEYFNLILVEGMVSFILIGLVILASNPYYKLDRYERRYALDNKWNKEAIRLYLDKKEELYKEEKKDRIEKILRLD